MEQDIDVANVNTCPWLNRENSKPLYYSLKQWSFFLISCYSKIELKKKGSLAVCGRLGTTVWSERHPQLLPGFTLWKRKKSFKSKALAVKNAAPAMSW